MVARFQFIDHYYHYSSINLFYSISRFFIYVCMYERGERERPWEREIIDQGRLTPLMLPHHTCRLALRRSHVGLKRKPWYTPRLHLFAEIKTQFWYEYITVQWYATCILFKGVENTFLEIFWSKLISKSS